MIVVRPFSNSDPPKLVELWNHQPATRGLAQPMTVSLLESQVFAKPYFDPKNLLIAESAGKVVGMAHLLPKAPWPQEAERSAQAGVPLILVSKSSDTADVEKALLEAAEARLAETGATRLLLGGMSEPGPYYFGLATGSCNRGILATDQRMLQLAQSLGYTATTSWAVYERTLRGFRPPVDRTQITARRSLNVLREDDPPYADYREACVFMHQHRTRYNLVQKSDSRELTFLTSIQMEAFSHLRGVRMAGIVDLHRLAGCTDAQNKFFLAEVLRQLAEEGTAVVEVQVASGDAHLRETVEALGFDVTNEVRLYSKKLA